MDHYGSQRSSQEQQKERGKTLKSNVKAVLLYSCIWYMSPGKWTVYSSIIKESSTDYKKTASYRQTQY